MNKNRLKRLNGIVTKIEEIVQALEAIKSEEEEALENTPEPMRGTERYEQSEAFIDNMSDALSNLNTTVDNLRENL